MADFATESANRVTQPAGTIGGNAPPTPPETQEIKSTDPISKGPATASESVNASSAPQNDLPSSALEPVKGLGESSTTAAPVPAQSTDSTIKAPESLADQLATDPDNTGDSVVSSAPINAETDAAKAPEEEAKQSPPKPVSVEVVQDAEGPTAKSAAVNDVAKPETTAANTASSAPKEAPQENDDTTTGGAQPTVTDGETKPDTVPVVSEPASVKPKTGAKRKAEEPATTNGEPGPEDKPAAAHPEKKQKSSPFKKALDKVSSAVKKGGRPKKEKKEPAPVGRTARVTRSQAKTD